MSKLQELIAAGFDLTEHIPFTKQYRVRCSSCEALVINGTPCHETGCPNQMHEGECFECGCVIRRNTRVPRGALCEDCANPAPEDCANPAPFDEGEYGR